jgi:hypothetical protein
MVHKISNFIADSAASPMAPVGLPVFPFNGLATKPPSVQQTPVPETRSSSVTHGNISTEMAAIIALIAFMIGVVVTGSMWFIHIKTGTQSFGNQIFNYDNIADF